MMDQIKKFMAWLAKYHFWLLSVLAVVICFVGWYLASSGLTTKFDNNKRAVEAQFGNLRTVRSEEAHPNQAINDGILKQTDQQRRRVYDVWQSLYDKQKEEVLFWPKALGEKFIQRVEGLKFGARLEQTMRERYMNYIKTRFEQLPLIVGASQQTTVGSARKRGQVSRPKTPRGGSEGTNVEPEDSYKVRWLDYGVIEERLVWERTPASLMIWLTQEDLWVYETLLKIIAKVNESASGHHDAVIKEIRQIMVGRDAAAQSKSTGRIWKLGQAAKERGGASSGARREESRGRSEGRSGEKASDPEAVAEALTVRRYLNEEGEPIEKAPVGDDSSSFKRLPIYMELLMDARELPRLLAECANATLPVEVKQVRINPGAQVRANRPTEGRRTARSGEGGEAADPAIVPVTIQGIIYIFNPPNRELLGLPAEEQPVADASAPPADT
ncbi:MAG: hypothetical protein ACC645_10720 [Pirellulales bacterium]